MEVGRKEKKAKDNKGKLNTKIRKKNNLWSNKIIYKRKVEDKEDNKRNRKNKKLIFFSFFFFSHPYIILSIYYLLCKDLVFDANCIELTYPKSIQANNLKFYNIFEKIKHKTKEKQQSSLVTWFETCYNSTARINNLAGKILRKYEHFLEEVTW